MITRRHCGDCGWLIELDEEAFRVTRKRKGVRVGIDTMTWLQQNLPRSHTWPEADRYIPPDEIQIRCRCGHSWRIDRETLKIRRRDT